MRECPTRAALARVPPARAPLPAKAPAPGVTARCRRAGRLGPNRPGRRAPRTLAAARGVMVAPVSWMVFPVPKLVRASLMVAGARMGPIDPAASPPRRAGAATGMGPAPIGPEATVKPLITGAGGPTVRLARPSAGPPTRPRTPGGRFKARRDALIVPPPGAPVPLAGTPRRAAAPAPSTVPPVPPGGAPAPSTVPPVPPEVAPPGPPARPAAGRVCPLLPPARRVGTAPPLPPLVPAAGMPPCPQPPVGLQP